MIGILERIETKLDQLIALVSVNDTDLENINEAFTKASEEIPYTNEPITAPLHVPAMEVPKPQTVTSGDLFSGVDKDGVVWDARIHSKAAVPISASTGKWKKRKGLPEGLYESVTTELLSAAPASVTAALSETNAAPAAAPTAAPAAPTAAPAVAKEAPVLPVVSNNTKVKVSALIRTLTDTYECEPNDIDQLMLEVVGFDTISKATDITLDAFFVRLGIWQDLLDEATKADEEMRIIADANGLMTDLNAALEGILEPHDANVLGLVHYSAIEGVTAQYQAYLTSWQDL
jgi:hypothetical protein